MTRRVLPMSVAESDRRRGAHGPTHVVGVGASAGGLESFQRFFGAVPADSSMCFIVVQHLAPQHRSLVSGLLRGGTDLRVVDAEHRALLRPGTLFVLQPQTNVEVMNGRIALCERLPSPPSPNVPINVLFESLAREYGERAVGVVLSGTGCDGTVGLGAIRRAGGHAIAEEAGSARFSGMPESAIAAGVDAVASAEDIPEELRRHAAGETLDARDRRLVLDRLAALLRERHRVDFSNYKQPTVLRRVERRKLAHGCASVHDYIRLLETSPTELDALASDLLIGVTSFFRDPDSFKALAAALRPILERWPGDGTRTLRVWSAACSTGEEPYSLAMSIATVARELKKTIPVKIFATDVSSAALAVAMRGIYAPHVEADIDPAVLSRYFRPEKDSRAFVVVPAIRKMVIFAQHDAIADPPFTRLDLVSCRNLLIYLSSRVQTRVLGRFAFALKPAGLLFMGSSESLGNVAARFDAVDDRCRIFRRKTDDKVASVGLGDFASNRTFAELRPSEREQHMIPSMSTGADGSAALLESLLESLEPPCFVVSRGSELLYVFGGATQFLRMRSGRLGFELGSMLSDDLGILIRAALERIWSGVNSVSIEKASFCAGDGRYEGKIRVQRLGARGASPSGAVVILDDLELVTEIEQGETLEIADAARQRLEQLESELTRTKERLQATVEELEAANEELQSANEELVSSNEELQSTNEELQSLNEELHTVNAELQAKVVELSDLTDDLDNLLENVESGVLFLDLEGRIRRFNQPAAEAFNLLSDDAGRPIGYVNHRFSDVDLEREYGDVLASLVGIERQVVSESGRSYILRIHPLRSAMGRVEGVLVSTNDITPLVETQNRLQLFSAVVEQSPVLEIFANAEGRIQYVNAACLAQLGATRDVLIGQDIRSLVSTKNDTETTSAVLSSIEGGEEWRGRLWVSQAGQPVSLEMARLFPVRSPAGEVTHLVKMSERLPCA